MNKWYAIQTIGGYEERIKSFVDKKVSYIRTLLPKRHLKLRKRGIFKDVIKSLYPGYFFINGEINDTFLEKIEKVKGFVKILWRNRQIKNIPEKEMEFIFKITDEDGVVDFSKGFFSNNSIRVISGPLMGLEGLITKIDKRKKRARVELVFFNRPLQVDLGFELLDNLT